MDEFDYANHWLIDRRDGVPIGMSMEVVDYFKNEGIHVMMSIGGITYVDFWDEALATDATQLGLNAALIAEHFGVGIEIDYERNSNPDLIGLQECWATCSGQRNTRRLAKITRQRYLRIPARMEWVVQR